VLGAALDSEMPRDQRSDLLAHFDAVTTENAFKWGDMSPGRGQTKFATADRMVAWARRHRLRLRAHNLFWHRLQTPRWVRPLIERSRRPKATLRRLMHDRIRKVVSRYAGRIDVWDVVNEPLALFGAGWDTADTALTAENFFYTTLGERYIDDAFRWTHRADPKGKLFLNELVWNPALGDAKADALLGLVRRLKRRGVPIDGVGIQTHGMLGLAPPSFPGSTASLVRYMRALVRLGVKVEITELDVALPLLPPSPDPFAAQAALFRRVAAACGRVRACTGLTVWGLRDPDTWLDTYEVTAGNAPNRPLLLDARGRPKPAYRAVVEALGIDPPGRSGR
jgi:endo-1,4-beta-xylanase